MADGVAITAGSGTNIATDDCGAAGHTQIVKLAISTDGSATAIPADGTYGLAVDVARIAAGDNNIGNVDLASAIPAGTNNIGATTDAGSAITVSWGVSGAPVESADMTTAANVTDAPTAGKKLVLVDAFIGVSAAMNILIEEESSGNDRLRLYFPGAGNYQVTPRAKFKHAVADKKFTCKASAAGAVSITFAYYSEA